METQSDPMPPEVRLVIRILIKNKMDPKTEDFKLKGRSLDNPIVIGVADGHVFSEYLVSEFLLLGRQYKKLSQACIIQDNKVIDQLTYEVSNKDGNVSQVNFYYDITEGYNNPPEELLNILRKKQPNK